MNSIELQEKLGAAKATQEALERQTETTMDLDELVQVQARLSASQEIVKRLAGQLESRLRYEHDAERRAVRLEQEQRKEELERLHREGCDSLALAIDRAARDHLESVFQEVMTQRAELGQMAEEHFRLLQKLTGQARPDVMLRLGGPALVPQLGHRLEDHEYSVLYGVLVTALTTATGMSAQIVNADYRQRVSPVGADLSRDDDTEHA